MQKRQLVMELNNVLDTLDNLTEYVEDLLQEIELQEQLDSDISRKRRAEDLIPGRLNGSTRTKWDPNYKYFYGLA